MKIAGAAGKYFGVDLRRAPVNIRFEGDGNVVHGGVIWLAESGKGIEFVDGTVLDSSIGDNNVRDIVINGYGDKDLDDDINGQPVEGGGTATGEEFAENAIGIDVNTQLKNTHITGVHVDSCTTAIDFSDGSIANDGSVIWIHATNCTDDVIWPAGETWDKNFDPNETCDIRINGERYYGPTNGVGQRP
jgi:hypothetical protein